MIDFLVSTPDEKRSISVSHDSKHNILSCKLPVEQVVEFLPYLEQRGYTVKMFELHETESQVYIARPQCEIAEFMDAMQELFTDFCHQ